MIGSFLQKNLIEGLNKVVHLSNLEKGSLPILNNILMRAEKGLLYFISTNLEIAIETYIRGKIKTPGSFTVPTTIFHSHLNFLNDELLLTVENNQLLIKHKKGETKIKGMSSEDFPVIPRLEKKNGFKVNGQEIKKALQQVSSACSSSEVRPEISGVLFQKNNNQLLLVGTDSYRLAEKRIAFKKTNENESEKEKIIIPVKTCLELLRILDDNDLEIFFSENQILFSQGSTDLISRVVQAEFPNYQEIIPNDFKTKAIINKDELVKTIRGVSPFSRLGMNDVRLDFLPDKGLIKISSLNAQVGEARLDLKAEIFGKKNALVFNYRYILEGLSNISGNEVSLELIDDSSPAVFKSADEKNLLYLLMPIRA